MTAVVGILNKQAVAIAADSAVTIGGTNGRKIFNKANKVFTLSKYHPVGVMIYNSASLMGTPWETIIKVYRSQLGDKPFPTVKDYQQDFINFLKTKQYYAPADVQTAFFENFALMIVNGMIKEVANKNKILIDAPTEENRIKFLQLLEEQAELITGNFSITDDYCNELTDYTFEMFAAYTNAVFENILQHRFIANGLNISDDLLTKIKQMVFAILRAKEDITNFTGLIFTGFGEDEIYPQLIPVNISMAIDSRLRYYINEGGAASISNLNSGAVCPFAQTDVIDTILSGIDPSLDNIYLNNFSALFKKYNQAILNNIGDSNPLLAAQIEALKTDYIATEFKKMNQQIKNQNYIIPLVNAVSSLSKDDLAEMAESLIYLTYLKRRITFAEESVGGPVDVAVISKGDGFVWIKRKHYFLPELNQHFFDNYFNK